MPNHVEDSCLDRERWKKLLESCQACADHDDEYGNQNLQKFEA